MDYDQPGTDTAEFVEIFNTTAGPVNLAGLRLFFINGATSVQYLSVDLSSAGSSLAAGQYLVIGNVGVTAALPAGVLSITIMDNLVQNGAPDGVAIYDSNSMQLVDALSYEGSITAATITGVPGTYNLVEGTALSPNVVDSNTVTAALIRSPNGTDTNNANSDWRLTTTPTPGVANVLTP